MNSQRRNMSTRMVFAGIVAMVVAISAPMTAVAATPGVGDVTDAMRYDVSGPFGAPLADLSEEDDETQTVAAPFPINFFGARAEGVCVTTNGGFYPVALATDDCSDEYDMDLENLALESQAPMIAALAGDLDLGNCHDNTSDGFGIPCEIYFGTTTVAGRDAFVITWYRVPMYEDDNDPALSNTFQIVIVKRGTGDATAGWDFDIEFNFGTLLDGEDGYDVDLPDHDCDPGSEGNPVCRWGVGWANFIPGSPNTADPYEMFPATPVYDLVDGGATPLIANSLNTSVLGRYTFAMVGGVTEGFSAPTMSAPSTPTEPSDPSPEAAPQLPDTGLSGRDALPVVIAAIALLAGVALVVVGRRRGMSISRP